MSFSPLIALFSLCSSLKGHSNSFNEFKDCTFGTYSLRYVLNMIGALCIQVVEDLEWAGGPVTISMRRSPKELSFSAAGRVTGSLTLALDTGIGARSCLDSFECAAASVVAQYKHKALRGACCMPRELMPAADADAPGLSKMQARERTLPGENMPHRTSKKCPSESGVGDASISQNTSFVLRRL